MQSVSSRIWTRVVVSISYDDNHYTTGTPLEESNSLYEQNLSFEYSFAEKNPSYEQKFPFEHFFAEANSFVSW